MKIPPLYSPTHEIIQKIAHIDSLRQFFSAFEVPPQISGNLLRKSLLKSSLFSARIEGNPLTEQDFITSSNDIKKKEIHNIISAHQYIQKNISNKTKISKNTVLYLHALVMNDLSSDAGKFRKEISAIFDQNNNPIYLTPPPEKIYLLINTLIQYIHSDQEQFILIKALLSHLIFEKIHPFLDGNGRVGRLLISTILQAHNYSFPIGIPFEEYLDNNKSDYYYVLENGLKQTNEYLAFMLNAFLTQVEMLKGQLLDSLKKNKTVLLPPRQEELYFIIKDHKVVSFDFLKRRFLKVPERTLRYDLKKLVEKQVVVKIGKTKGVYYSAN